MIINPYYSQKMHQNASVIPLHIPSDYPTSGLLVAGGALLLLVAASSETWQSGELVLR